MGRKTTQEELSIAAEYANLLLELLEEKGFDRQQVLEGTDLTDSQLTNPDFRVNYRQYKTLMDRAISLSGDPSLAVQLGTKLDISTHGFLGYAAMSSDTLRKALEISVKYFRTRSTILELEFYEDDQFGILQINEMVPLDNHQQFAIECLLSALHVIGQKLIPSFSVEEFDGMVTVTFEKPAYFDKVMGDIANSIHFEAAHNQIRIPKKYLDLNLSLADPKLSEMAAHQCAEQLQMIGGSEGLLSQVRRIIEKDNGQTASLEKVAGELNVSSRTLKRKLKALDTSYQRILDNVRKGKAIEFLTTTSMTVDEIADNLGYSDPSNFGRAFRKWTGKSPTQYRVHGSMR